jgi:Acyl-CoA dehydrogenases
MIATRRFRSRISAICAARDLLSICIPKSDGGTGADFQTYCIAAAELGRYCGATALTVEHARVLDPVVGSARRRPADEPGGPCRSQRASRPALSSHYCRWRRLCAAVLGGRRRRGRHGRVRHRGAPRRGRLRRQRQEDFRLALGRRGLLRRAVHRRAESAAASRRNTLYLAIPADAPGVQVVGDWDPLGMRGTVSRTLLFRTCSCRRPRC